MKSYDELKPGQVINLRDSVVIHRHNRLSPFIFDPVGIIYQKTSYVIIITLCKGERILVTREEYDHYCQTIIDGSKFFHIVIGKEI